MLDFFQSIEQWPISTWVRDSGSVWSFPTILLLHTLGMSMVAGGSAIVSLVLLGCWPVKAPVKPLDRYFPLMWAGFGLNLVTGLLMLMADATTKLTNPDFYVKMVSIAVGIAMLSMTRRKIFRDPLLDRGPLPDSAKLLAWGSLACWFVAITAGRLLAYVGPQGGPPGVK